MHAHVYRTMFTQNDATHVLSVMYSFHVSEDSILSICTVLLHYLLFVLLLVSDCQHILTTINILSLYAHENSASCLLQSVVYLSSFYLLKFEINYKI